MKKDSTAGAIYSIQTVFDEDAVTPFLVLREFSLNPDYKYDNFYLCLQLEATDADADSFVRWTAVSSDSVALEIVSVPGVRLFFSDGDSLVLDMLVDYSNLNNNKSILTTDIVFDKSNINLFLIKEIAGFALIGRV